MSNPFDRKFDGQCDRCGDTMLEGEITYAFDDEFMCFECAQNFDIVCMCDNVKKPEYAECYECHNI